MSSLSIFNTDATGNLLVSRRRRMLPTTNRHRFLVGSVFLGMFAGVLLIAFFMPRTYEGSMQFLLSNERMHTPVGPDKTPPSMLYADEVGEARVNTEIAILTSTDLLRQVVHRTNLLEGGGRGKLSPQQQEEKAVYQLKKDLEITPLKKSAIIQIHYRSSNPAHAVQVLRTLSDLYLDSHLQLRGDRGSSSFFEGLWRDYSSQRKSADDALAGYKAKYNILTLPEDKALSLQREADLERQYADARGQTSRSSHQASTLLTLLSSTAQTIVGQTKTVPNQTEITQLNSVLLGLQNNRVTAASRYLPSDRVLVDLDRQITQTQSSLKSATAKKAEEVSTIANPVLSGTQSEYIHSQYELAGARAVSATLTRQLLDNRKRLSTLDEQSSSYALLTENVARLASLEHDYQEKADAAHVSQRLDEEHISDVALVEHPYAPSRPVSPHVPAILAMGLLWSAGAAAGCSYMINRPGRRLSSPLDLERALGSPVLACVRDVPSRSGHGNLNTPSTPSMDPEPDSTLWGLLESFHADEWARFPSSRNRVFHVGGAVRRTRLPDSEDLCG